MKIKLVSPGLLTPYESNPRQITDAAVAAVALSIEESGFRQPIVVDADNVIIIGHTRLLAAQKLGLKKVPVHVADDLSEDKVKALRLNDNKAGEISGWDQMLLSMEVSELAANGFDLAALAFEDDELSRLMEAGEDFVPIDPGSLGGVGVTEDDLTKAGEGAQLGERSKQILVEVTCPSCAESFFLAPEELKE